MKPYNRVVKLYKTFENTSVHKAGKAKGSVFKIKDPQVAVQAGGRRRRRRSER